MAEFSVTGRKVGDDHPTYFIADIAANHDGDLARATALIHIAAEAGADAVKFQHFQAARIVSDWGFRRLGSQRSHQAKWQKPVYEVYEDASLPRDWNRALKEAADQAGVHFFSSPYDLDAVDGLEALGVPAYKMGSGEITWPVIIERMIATGKPLFAATGASTLADVDRLMGWLGKARGGICLMQCNTNYTGSIENFRHIDLNVLKSYAVLYPWAVPGLSDHTPGHATVLGAVALGARAIEKHFTDDTTRTGPDHGFSMDPRSWRDMVDRTRELELALGSTVKRVADNERETVVVQRRALYAAHDLEAGHRLAGDDLVTLRPAPDDAVFPYQIDRVLGRTLRRALSAGEQLRFEDVA
jgi:N-acetylneuraminate synthase